MRSLGRFRWLLNLALVAGAFTTMGYAARPWVAQDGLRLTGRVQAVQLRPLVADGCAQPASRQAAVRDFLVTEQAKRQLAALWRPIAQATPADLQCQALALRVLQNLIVNAGENYLVDAFQNTTEPENLKYHGIGTGVTAAAEGDTTLLTELTTQYNPDNTRATGSLTEGASANIFRTVGTNTVDGAVAITEWGLLSQAATGGGTLWSRAVFSAINLASGDSLQTTYDLTVESILHGFLLLMLITTLIPRRAARRMLPGVRIR